MLVVIIMLYKCLIFMAMESNIIISFKFIVFTILE